MLGDEADVGDFSAESINLFLICLASVKKASSTLIDDLADVSR